MPDLGVLIEHWGYVAIFVTVVLGNVGLPVPEETILALAGYLVWAGRLRLPAVLLVGVVSAVAGDNLGYWIGRRYGRPAIERYGHWILATPDRLDAVSRFVGRYGAWGVFVARFVPGLRFLAGPLAGATGLPPGSFVTANTLGATLYVPTMVGLGYAIGYGLGAYVTRFRLAAARFEHVVLIAAAVVAGAALLRRAIRAARGLPPR
jgi:membrane protein DedA with SNARE-associated domain